MSKSDGKLHGKAILITGGGTGIGRACAARLVADGAAVTICGRREANLKDAVSRITKDIDYGGSVQYAVCDVTNEAEIKAVVAKAASGSHLHGVIANAGGGGAPELYGDVSDETYRAIFELNVMGTLYCLRHSLPLMANASGGSFVAMSSIAAHMTAPYGHAYGASKASVESMMKNAADEYGPKNIRFNAIRPGFIMTEISEAFPPETELHQAYLRNTPLGRVGEAEDVAELARFLIGPESSWITGQCINVDGGNSLRKGASFDLALKTAD